MREQCLRMAELVLQRRGELDPERVGTRPGRGGRAGRRDAGRGRSGRGRNLPWGKLGAGKLPRRRGIGNVSLGVGRRRRSTPPVDREHFHERTFDLELAAMRCQRNKLVERVGSQVRRDETDCGQMQPPVRHRVEEGGKASRRARGRDALVRGIIGKMESLDAVGVHGRVAAGEVKPSSVDLGDVGEQRRRSDAVLRDKRRHGAEQRGVVQVREIVASQLEPRNGGAFRTTT